MPPHPDITVLIPTYNRPDYLKRQTRFIATHFADAPHVRFIVLDGSREEWAQTNRTACQNAGIEYQHYGPEIHIYDRFLAGVEQVETEYVTFLADDDLLNPDGFFQALDFLKKQPAYVAAHGRYLGFQLEPNQPYYFWDRYKKIRSIEQDSPFQRLFQLFCGYIPIIYSVQRTRVLKTAFQQVLESVDRDDYRFHEYLVAGIILAYGKVKVLNSFYMAREFGQSMDYAYRHSNSGTEIFDPRFHLRYARFKQGLITHLHAQGLTGDYLDKAVDIIFSAHIGTYMSKFYLETQLAELLHAEKTGQTQEEQKQLEDKAGWLKLKHKLRHPKQWLKRDFNYRAPQYAKVVDFLLGYQLATTIQQELETVEKALT